MRPTAETTPTRSSSRAQTEPVAALVAVAALIVGILLYGVYITDIVSSGSDRTTEEPTLEQVRQEIVDDGVFRAHRHATLGSEIETESLPSGRNVYVEVTIVNEKGVEEVVADAFFGTDGEPDRDPIDDGELDGPPAEAGVAEQPVSVATAPGDVRGGTLRVGVWSG